LNGEPWHWYLSETSSYLSPFLPIFYYFVVKMTGDSRQALVCSNFVQSNIMLLSLLLKRLASLSLFVFTWGIVIFLYIL